MEIEDLVHVQYINPGEREIFSLEKAMTNSESVRGANENIGFISRPLNFYCQHTLIRTSIS